MSRVKLIIAGYAAAVALSALLPPPAPAATPGWMVNGTQLAGSKKLASGGVGAVALIAAGVEVLCTESGFAVTNGQISAPVGMLIGSLTFSECAANKECTLAVPTLSTTPIFGIEITLDGALAVRGVFKPETKEILATIKYEGPKCVLSGVQTVKGSLDFLMKEGQDEKTNQLLSIFSLPGQLQVGANAATFTAGLKLKLESGETWSFL